MRFSQSLIVTRRDAPADAETISHQLMVRAGFIRKLASGIYTYLPLCLRTLRKIEQIIREELNAAGAQELLMPVVMPASLWKESERWDFYGKELLRFKDRKDNDFCLGPTHEEAITDLVRNDVKSYRQLPLNLYQIQTKFRDEIRPRFGLMRGREFIMKDGYSFDANEETARVTYQKMYDAYMRIFERCGLEFRPVDAMTGAIGGSLSHEFQVLAETGEDPILASSETDYAANIEKAPLDPTVDLESVSMESGRNEKVETPKLTSVEEVASFLGVGQDGLVKTLVFETDAGPIAALVRGDQELVEEKLKLVSGVEQLVMASEKTIHDIGSAVGFTGPLGLKIPVYADYGVAAMKDFVVGANERDVHLKNVNLGDFEVKGFFDLRRAVAGDPCPEGGVYEGFRGIEVGHVFYLGDKYSRSMKAVFLDEQGKEQYMVMGCYGIGVGRTAAAAIEQNHDESGIIWPRSIAPYEVVLISLKVEDAEVARVSKELYQRLQTAGVEIIWDDRKESPGVKFKDADLIGFPFQIVVGVRGLQDKQVEIKNRQTGEKVSVALDQVETAVKQRLEE